MPWQHAQAIALRLPRSNATAPTTLAATELALVHSITSSSLVLSAGCYAGARSQSRCAHSDPRLEQHSGRCAK